jgi:hypothetical protein
VVVISRQCGRNGIHLTFGDLGLPGHQRFRNCSRPPALLTWTDFARSFEVPRAVPSGSFGHSETGPKWVLGEISPVMSRHIMLAGSGLRQRPQKHRATSLICVFLYTSTARGLPSRLLWLYPSTQASIAVCASWLRAARPGRFRAPGEDVVATPGAAAGPRRATAPSPTTISIRRSRSPSHQCRQPTTGSARPRSPMQDDEPHRQMTALGKLKVTGFLLIRRFYH